MLRVADLLTLPIFKDFCLINKAGGINNRVSGTGVLEWESPEEIYETFNPGDMVFITQYMQPGDHTSMEEGMRALIKLRVAALAIKTATIDGPLSRTYRGIPRT